MYVGGTVNPTATNPGAGEIWVTNNGGSTGWTDISGGAGATGPHASVHALTVTSAGNLIAATDGGVFEYNSTTDLWSDLNGDLAISQTNGIAPNPTSVTSVVGGFQSNGTAIVGSFQANTTVAPSLTWAMVDDTNLPGSTDDGLMGGGQVFVAQQLPPNEGVTDLPIYATQLQLGGNAIVRRSLNGGTTWSTILTSVSPNIPIDMDNINPDRLVAGGGIAAFNGVPSPLQDPINGEDFDGLIETFDAANSSPTWINLDPPNALGNKITAIGLPEYQGPFVANVNFPDVTDQGANTYDPNTIYITNGTSVYVTKDNGTRWANITGGAAFVDVTSLVVDPSNRDTVYAIDTGAGKIYVYSDATVAAHAANPASPLWVEIAGAGAGGSPVLNSPPVPFWSLAVDPRNGNLYAGTDIGVFVLPNGTNAISNLISGNPVQQWQPFGIGMPKVQVKELILNQTTNTLLAGTYGRGVFEMFLSAQESAPYDAPSAVTTTPVVAAVTALSGTPEWTGPILLQGDPTTNTVVLGAEGNPEAQNPLSTVQLNILGIISDAPGQAAAPTLDKTGLGSIELSGPNTYAGLTDIQQGALIANNFSALGGIANGTTVEDGAALDLASSVDAEPLTLMGDGTGEFNGHFTGALESIAGDNIYFGTIYLAQSPGSADPDNVTIGVESGSTLTIVGSIENADPTKPTSLTKELPGTLIFDEPASSPNNYTTTYVYQGALQIDSSVALQPTSVTEVLDGRRSSFRAPPTPITPTSSMRTAIRCRTPTTTRR